MARGLSAVVLCALALAPSYASADEEPSTSQNSSSDTGHADQVNASGGFGVSVPLDLPPTRSGIELPISISSGGRHVGAVGLGWDMPLSFIRTDVSIARRKPANRESLASRQLVTMSIGGQIIELQVKWSGGGWVDRRGASLWNVQQDGMAAWNAFDGQGHAYRFSQLGGDDLSGVAYLTDIVGVGGEEVHIDYQPLAQSGSGVDRVAYDMYKVSYNYASSTCPKDVVTFTYQESATPIGASVNNDFVYWRRTALKDITLDSYPTCSGGPTRIRTYDLSYEPDPDTQLSRLKAVDMWGRGGTPQGSSPLRIATYTYNSATDPSQGLTYAPATTISMPAGADISAITGTFQTAQSTPSVSWYATVQTLRDVNGDGVADMVFSENGALQIARGIVSVGGGISFDSPVPLGDGPITISGGIDSKAVIHDTRGSDDHDHVDIEQVWREMIDVNGDGRLDIVDGQEVANEWTIYLNTPSNGPSGVLWQKRAIDLHTLRGWLSAERDTGSDDHLELAHRYTARAFHEDEYGDPDSYGAVTSFTEWDLRDLNGDGFPDFVYNTKGIDFIDKQDAGYTHASSHYPEMQDGNQVAVMYDVAGIALRDAPAGDDGDFSYPEMAATPNEQCGVEQWTSNAANNSMDCGFSDVNGDGIADRIDGYEASIGLGTSYSPSTIHLGQSAGVYTTPYYNTCTGNSFGVYQTEFATGIRDLTGDGIPDMVTNKGVRIGSGVGFGNMVPASGLVVSAQTQWCYGMSKTTAGLFDIDGDGTPEVVTADGAGHLVVSTPSVGGAPIPRGVGQISRVTNAYGATTDVTYRSAKEDRETPHSVPFSEIVVGTVTTSIPSSVTSTMTTKYAYGDAEMMFNERTGTFEFPGYRRSIVENDFSHTGERYVGQVVVTDRLGLADFDPGMTKDQRFARQALLGRTSSATKLAGALPIDPIYLLNVDTTNDARIVSKTAYQYGTKLFDQGAQPIESIQDCISYVNPYDYDQSLGYIGGANNYDVCSSYGFSYVSDTRTTRGSQTTSAGVATETSVLQIDDYGRPTYVWYRGDAYRIDDDVCVFTSYATPNGDAYPVLDAPSGQLTWGCAESPQIYAVDSFEYDGYAPGTVGQGLLTSRTSQRHSMSDGSLLSTRRVFDATHDAFGNVSELKISRDDGAWKIIDYGYDEFHLMRTSTTVTTSNTPPTAQITTYDLATYDVLFTTDTNGTTRGTTYDGYDRPLTTTISSATGPSGVIAAVSYSLPYDPGGRSVTVTTFDDPVDPANVGSATGHVSKTSYDELGREVSTVESLGASYGGAALETYRTYDSYGRVAFQSEPFVVGEDPSTAMGTTHYYQVDGSPDCFVRAKGPHAYANVTDVASNVFPTCFARSYASYLETTSTALPDANDPTSPQAGLVRATTTTATGRRLAQTQTQGGTVLDYSTFTYDHLGNETSMTRYGYPQTAGQPVTTYYQFDSLGQKISQTDPESATRNFSYDSWGNQTTEQWVDPNTGVDSRVVRTYDARGRITHREDQNAGTADPNNTFDYVYDTPFSVGPEAQPANVLGRLSKAVGPTSTVYLGYDTFGNVNASTRVANDGDRYVSTEVFHANGSLKSTTLYAPDTGYKAENVDYGYDSAARSTSVDYKGPFASQSIFSRGSNDPRGRISDAKYGAAKFSATFQSDGRRLLNDARVDTPSGYREYAPKAYDALGRMTWLAEHSSATGDVEKQTTYDALGHVYDVVERDNGALTTHWEYTYDPLGNLARAYDTQNPTAGFSVTNSAIDRDRLCKIQYLGVTPPTSCNVTYDAVGNVTREGMRSGNRSFAYFDDGLTKSFTLAKTTNGFVLYDPLGGVGEMEVRTISNERVDLHYGDAFDVRTTTPRFGGALETIRRNIAAPGVVATLDGATKSFAFAFSDKQGVRFTVDANGKFLQDESYNPYGVAKSSGLQPGDKQYESAEWNGGDGLDNFGITQIGARFYDPATGRFLSRDPLTITTSSSASNPYSFAGGDPVNGRDPSGMECTAEDPRCAADLGLGNWDHYSGAGTDVDPHHHLAEPAHTGNGAMGADGEWIDFGDSFSEDTLNDAADRWYKSERGYSGRAYDWTSHHKLLVAGAVVALATAGTATWMVLAADGAELTTVEVTSDMIIEEATINSTTDATTTLTSTFVSAAPVGVPASAVILQHADEIEAEAAEAEAEAGRLIDTIGQRLEDNMVAAESNPTACGTNCGNVAMATDRALSTGQAVTAQPSGIVTTGQVAGNYVGGYFSPMSGPNGIVQTMQALGNGARGIVFGNRGWDLAGNPIVGHFFNVINRGGVVTFVDGQNPAGFISEAFVSVDLMITSGLQYIGPQ